MKKVISLIIFSISGVYVDYVMAAGFEPIPSPGSGSAYIRCRANVNFGFTPDTGFPPPIDDICVVVPGIGVALGLNSAPQAGFTLQSSNASAITAFSETLGVLNERVFRNAAAGECAYEKQIVMSSATTHDYNPQLAGTQKMEVNDYAFGGYTGTPIWGGYAKSVANASSVFRIGRTFTSVQVQADPINPNLLASGYMPLPTDSGVRGTEIYGVGQTLSPPGTPVPSQQQAPLSGSWVDFTVDVTADVDEDGVTNSPSPNMYIKQACASATVTAIANSFKLRQTGQTTQPWVIITAVSRAPSGDLTP